MSIRNRFQSIYTNNPIVDSNGILTSTNVAWFNNLIDGLNQIQKSARDDQGPSATNQLDVPVLKVPNVSSTLRDTFSPQPGVLIFNTDSNTLQFYDGTTWKTVATL